MLRLLFTSDDCVYLGRFEFENFPNWLNKIDSFYIKVHVCVLLFFKSGKELIFTIFLWNFELFESNFLMSLSNNDVNPAKVHYSLVMLAFTSEVLDIFFIFDRFIINFFRTLKKNYLKLYFFFYVLPFFNFFLKKSFIFFSTFYVIFGLFSF